ncbi:hypothetical protein OAR00_00965 [Alphaproteobacteria bacterium]|nr:hypothetical protein [Alphaproteobacteria bacterium]MDC1023104.1 hypothetical protein [Alphaproteobacteria bacterium]
MKKDIKNICLISDSYIPQKISAAGMIYNLSREFINQNINVTCAFSGKINTDVITNYNISGIHFITTNIFSKLRNKSLIFRFFFEAATAIVLSVKCYFYYRKKNNLDLIVWYGPSVFLWLVVKSINFSGKIPVYYILRDIFPDWLVSLKVLKNIFLIKALYFLTNYQYNVSDVIGVETKENIGYVKRKISKDKKVELLLNWPNLTKPKNKELENKTNKNFQKYIKKLNTSNVISSIYLGNASVAHDYYSMVSFLSKLSFQEKSKFEINNFGKLLKNHLLNKLEVKQNFWGMVPEQILPSIFDKIEFGIVCLNRRSVTHNIPGKFVSYTQHSLPIICFANKDSSLAKLIVKYRCGIVIDLDLDQKGNIKIYKNFIDNFYKKKKYFSQNSFKLYKNNFDTKNTVKKILSSIEK